MCGRYSQAAGIDSLSARFGLEPPDFPLSPRYNIAPTQNAPVVVLEDRRRLRLMRWGLIPRWAKDPAIDSRMINARAETLREKPSFKTPFERGRCLVLTDGFFEWKKEAASRLKTPMLIRLKGAKPFAFAGIFDRWRGPEAKEIVSYAVITTSANDAIKPIHDRMPVILRQEDEEVWLDPKTSLERAERLLAPYPATEIESHPVSTLVNSPSHDSPDCLKPAQRHS